MQQRFTTTQSAGRVSIQSSGDDELVSARVLYDGKYIGVCAEGANARDAEAALVALIRTLISARGARNLTLHDMDVLSLAALYIKTVKENAV